MLFFNHRVLLTAISAIALIQFTAARPLPSLTEDLNALVERHETSANSPLAHDWLYPRQSSGQITKEVKANPFKSKRKPAPTPVPKAKSQRSSNKRKALPNVAKLTLSKNAREELDRMKLHGKERRQMIKWHKTQIKNEMKTNPLLNDKKARTGIIQHIAHEGGSEKTEKNHITASFFDKDKNDVFNNFNGGKNHHLYVKSTKGLSKVGKAALERNNAYIRGESISHQKSLSKTRTPGKSSKKGKGKQKSGKNFSKNPNKHKI